MVMRRGVAGSIQELLRSPAVGAFRSGVLHFFDGPMLFGSGARHYSCKAGRGADMDAGNVRACLTV